mgnify:CR=1 FL=1
MAVNKENVKIHVSHLKKSFGTLEVLKDISTDIHEGEVSLSSDLPEAESLLFSVV